MSNYLSQPIEKTKIESTFNAPLADKALSMLQGKYDANKAMIDQTLAMYKNNLKGLRDFDNEYISARLKEADSYIKSYGNKDFSLTSTTNTLTNNLKSIVEDPIIQSAVLNKAKKDKYDLEVDKIKKEGKGTYNNRNYKYGLHKAGYDAYMKGESNSIGSLDYTPYIDYKATSMEKAIKLKQLKGEETIEVPDGRGGKIVTKINGLTPNEVINYFPELLNEQERAQMKIDGWGVLAGADKSVIQQQADTYFSTLKEELTNKIKEEENIINLSTSSASQRDESTRLKNVYTTQLKDLEEKEGNIDKTDAEQVGYLLNKQSYMNMAKNLFTGRKSVTYEEDKVFNAERNYLLAVDKFELDKQKEQREVMEFEAKMAKEYNLNPDGTKKQWETTPIQNQNVEDATDLYADTKDTFNKAYNTVISTAESAYNDALSTKEHKELFEANLKKYDYKIENGKIVSTIKDNKVSKASAAEMAFKFSGMYNIKPEYEKIISDSSEKRRVLSNALVKAEKEFDKDFDVSKYVDNFQNVAEGLASNSIFRALDLQYLLGHATRPPGLTEEDLKRVLVATKMEQFVKGQGGTEALKLKIKNNPSLAIKMKELIQEAADSDFLIVDFGYEDPSKTSRKMSEALKKEGIQDFTKMKMSANVPTEQERANIINLLPQQLNDEKGNPQPLGLAKFDAKAPMTVIQGTDYIDIIQDKGVNTKGETLKPAKHRVFKNSAGYNEIMKNIDSDVEFKINAQNVPTSYKVESSIKPIFVANSRGSDDPSVGNFYNRYVTNVNPNLRKEIQTRALGIDPRLFATKEDTKNAIKAVTKGKVTDEQITKLVDKISDNYEKYKVEIIPNNRANWVVKLDTPTMGATRKYLTSSPELDSDYTYIVKNMPQILIMTEIINKLAQDPSSIDKI